MDTTTNLSIAALVFGVISFLLVIAYVVITHFVLPYSPAGGITITDGISYAVLIGLAVVMIINITYASLHGAGKTNPGSNTALVASSMTILAIANVALGYGAYIKIGKNMADSAQYFKLLLPANLLISVVASSLIIMQKVSSV